MTKGERNEFVQLSKQYKNALKSDGELQAARIVEAFEMEISQLWDANDERWADAVAHVNEAAARLNESVRQHVEALGFNPAFSPSIQVAWAGRGENWSRERREELRRVAKAQADVMRKGALARGERLALEVQRTLLVDELSAAQARDLIRSLPTVAQMMPALNVEKIESIARAQDRRQSYRKLWSEDEPLLTGRPLAALTNGTGADESEAEEARDAEVE